jgi:hypothetical protein
MLPHSGRQKWRVVLVNPDGAAQGRNAPEWLRTNAVGSNYNDTIVLFGSRLQRWRPCAATASPLNPRRAGA